MAGQSPLLSPLTIIPSSPSLTPHAYPLSLISFGWTCEDPQSSRTPKIPYKEAVLCGPRQPLDDILESLSNVTLSSPPSRCCKDHSSPNYFRFSTHPSSAPHLRSHMPTHLVNLPHKYNKSTMLPAQPWRRPSHVRFDTGTPILDDHDYGAEYVGKPNIGLGLILGIAGHPPAFAPATPRYSPRLRNIAPPSLQLDSAQPPQYTDLFPMRSRSVPTDFEEVPSPPPCDSARRQPRATDAPISTTPTALSYSGHTSDASLSSFELLQWRRSIVDAANAARSPRDGVVPGATVAVGSTLFGIPQQLYAPGPPSSHANYGHVQTAHSLSEELSPSSNSFHLSPPPLPRLHPVELPPHSHDSNDRGPPEHLELHSTLDTTPRASTTEVLVVRAKKCSELASHVGLSLTSCSLLREPEQIQELCHTLQDVFVALQEVLDNAPAMLEEADVDALHEWKMRHCTVLDSLDRNLDLFLLFAERAQRRPPRIHRLADFVRKLQEHLIKFKDLTRRAALSYQKFNIIMLRTRFAAEQEAASMWAETERARRREFRAAWTDARARRREMRLQLRQARSVTQHLQNQHGRMGPLLPP